MQAKSDTSQGNIIIAPIGNLEAKLIDLVAREVHRFFGYSSNIQPLLKNVDFAFESSRRQYYSTPILERLSELAPPHTIKVLAITRVDLFIPILTHVYGEAQLGGTSCIISTSRLAEGLGLGRRESFSRRVVKEAIHELGHTFNLRHCKDRSCGMHYCRTIEDVDGKSGQFCRYCQVLLTDAMKRLRR